MASYENFYEGGGYGMNQQSSFTGYRPTIGQIGFPTDATTANQLKNVASKIRTGVKVIEVSGLGIGGGGPMKALSAIPKQHWKEMERLKKLTGVELTFHGPLVEPTGLSRGNWSEDQRLEVEGQMISAIDLAQKLDPNGNVIVTFHSSNGLPEPEKIIKTKEGIETVQMAIVNERSGEVTNLPFSKEDYFDKQNKLSPEAQLRSINNSQWTDKIEAIVLANNRAKKEIDEALTVDNQILKQSGGVAKLYNKSKTNPKEFENEMKKLSKINPNAVNILENNTFRKLDDAGFFIEDSYLKLKDAYNNAYDSLKKEGPIADKLLNNLDNYSEVVRDTFKKWRDGEASIAEVSSQINEGTKILENYPVKLFRPLRNWAIDKSSDSFANTALHGLLKFKNNAPIISIENPPVGLGLTKGDDLRDLVKETRRKFISKAIETGISKSQAEKQAEKLIGVTWDTGHINSLRKFGFDEADIINEAKKVAPYVKHMHAVDNLGFEDSELPPGMGNVPFEKILASHPNFRKAKKIIEASDWFLRGSLGQTGTPVRQAFEGFGSSAYDTMDYPTWSQASTPYGAYFSGIGDLNPQVHHSIYGAGFSNLPSELGGQIAGGQSRFSGAPME